MGTVKMKDSEHDRHTAGENAVHVCCSWVPNVPALTQKHHLCKSMPPLHPNTSILCNGNEIKHNNNRELPECLFMGKCLNRCPLIPWEIIQQFKRIYTFIYTHTFLQGSFQLSVTVLSSCAGM